MGDGGSPDAGDAGSPVNEVTGTVLGLRAFLSDRGDVFNL